jgi:hypothetical protein
MIAMDLFYLKNMSILLDLKIMLKTCAVIAGQLFESRQAAQRGPQGGSARSPTAQRGPQGGSPRSPTTQILQT